MTAEAGQGEARWEYAMLNWEGGGMGKHRSLHFTHRQDVEKIGSGEMYTTIGGLGDQGFELVAVVQTSPWTSFWFKRQLA